MPQVSVWLIGKDGFSRGGNYKKNSAFPSEKCRKKLPVLHYFCLSSTNKQWVISIISDSRLPKPQWGRIRVRLYKKNFNDLWFYLWNHLHSRRWNCMSWLIQKWVAYGWCLKMMKQGHLFSSGVFFTGKNEAGNSGYVPANMRRASHNDS